MKASVWRAPLGAVLCALVVGAIAVSGGGNSAEATGTGPGMSVGSASLVSGNVEVPISATGSVVDPYFGFNIHLTWDPGVFTFSSANNTGTVINAPFCPPPAVDAGGGGVIFGCTSTGGSTSTTGLLGTIVLTPISGCSALHLFTFGPPDNGDSTTGTYTINAADFTAQSNTYTDGSADATGAQCSPSATSTPAPAATATDTPVPGATNTPVSGSTNTPVATATSGGQVLVATPTSTPTSKATPGASTPSAGGSPAPPPPSGPVATSPSGSTAGAGAGAVRLPNTGYGETSGGFPAAEIALIAAVMAVLAIAGGYVWRRKVRGA